MISAIVLAAGMSTRMGKSKAVLTMGDKTFLRHVIDSTKLSGVEDIVVVLGRGMAEIRRGVALDDVKVVENREYERGMSTSIHAGLLAVRAESEAILVALADQPLVKPSTIQLLLDEYRRLKPGIVIPVFQGFRGNPVLVHKRFFPELMQIHGDIGCRAIFGRHPDDIHRVEVSDPGVLVDIDTPEDLEKALELYTHGAAGSLRKPVEFLGAPEQNEGKIAESYSVQPKLLILGKTPLVFALTRLASAMKMAAYVVDPLATTGDFPNATKVYTNLEPYPIPITSQTYVIVATHAGSDEPIMQRLVNTDSQYVAVVAGRQHATTILDNLRRTGVPPNLLAKIKSPAGIDIGAVTPEEIALSVVADIVKHWRTHQN